MRSRRLLSTALASAFALVSVASLDVAVAGKGTKNRPGSSRSGSGVGGGLMDIGSVTAKAAPAASAAAKFATGGARAQARGTALTESYDDSSSSAFATRTPKKVTAEARNLSIASAHAESYAKPVPRAPLAPRAQVIQPTVTADAYAVTAAEVKVSAKKFQTEAVAEAGGFGYTTLTDGLGTTYAEVAVQTKATATFGNQTAASAEFMSQGNTASVAIANKNVTATGGAAVVQKIGSNITAVVATGDGLALASVSKTRALAFALTGATSYDGIVNGLFSFNVSAAAGGSASFAYASQYTAFGAAGAVVTVGSANLSTSVGADAGSLVLAGVTYTPIAQTPVIGASEAACGLDSGPRQRVTGRLTGCCAAGPRLADPCREAPRPVMARS